MPEPETALPPSEVQSEGGAAEPGVGTLVAAAAHGKRVNTLRDIADFDGSRPLLALDVDGPLNRFDGNSTSLGPATRLVRTAHGAKYQVDFYPERIAELDRIITDYGVELGWLTTWGPNVRALIEQAFDGQLAGGFVLKKQPARYRGSRPADWKFTGLRDRIRATGQPWVWVDDEQIAIAELYEPHWLEELRSLAPGLTVHVDEREMVTMDQLALIEEFFQEHTSRR